MGRSEKMIQIELSSPEEKEYFYRICYEKGLRPAVVIRTMIKMYALDKIELDKGILADCSDSNRTRRNKKE